jgi:hypothetical protein
MIIDELANLPLPVQSTDELPIERGELAYKVDYDNMVGNSLSAIESSIAIIVNGNTTSTTIAAGQYVYIKGSTILTEGLYTANSAVPSGTTVSSTYFAPVSGGGLNAIQQSMANLVVTDFFESDTITVGAGSNASATIYSQKTGYTAVAIAGITSFSSAFMLAEFAISSSGIISIAGHNIANAQISGKIIVHVLFIRNA